MISADEIQAGLSGAWQLMLGKTDGVRLLDLSADGFWNSFFAMLVALPPLFAMWTSLAIDVSPAGAAFGERISLLLRLAFIDFAAWVVPLIALAVAASRVGIADRFVPYTVATNWASGILAWLTVPPVILGALFPAADDAVALLWLPVFVASLVLVWRLTNAVLGKGAGLATAVFTAMIGVSLIVVYGLDFLLGIPVAVP